MKPNQPKLFRPLLQSASRRRGRPAANPEFQTLCDCPEPEPRYIGGFDAWQCDRCGYKYVEVES